MKMKYIFLILILHFITVHSAFAQGIRSKVKEGNKEFNEEKYEDALSKYQDALLDDPVNEKIIFNKGDALYKLKKYDESIEEFQKVVGSEDLTLSAKALHNIGNAYFSQNKLQESIDAYKRSLELNPDDYDTKYNLELARAKLKEMAEKKPQNQNQQNQQQKQNQQNQNQQGQQDQQQQNQDQQQKEKQNQQQQQNKEEKQAQESKEKKPEEGDNDEKKMDKDEAERILNALSEEEQDSQENKTPIKVRGRRTSKDW